MTTAFEIVPSIDPDPACPFCEGTGEADSGGFTPWDAPISIRCGCTYADYPNREKR